MKLSERFRRGVNAFTTAEEKAKKPDIESRPIFGGASFVRPDRNRFRSSLNTKDLTTAIFTRFSVDFANVDIRHSIIDGDKRFKEEVKSGLNDCLNIEANIDQSGFDFRRDIANTVLREGVACVVPIDTNDEPNDMGSYDIHTMRVGTITQWRPYDVTVRLWRESISDYQEIPISKARCAIIENPFYDVMNEPNSTARRLARKISLMDQIDEQVGSGKLDLIIQLPYVVKGETKREQAENRRSELERQLSSSQYGVAYTESTERITQLNRPVENQLTKNVAALTDLLYQELGITAEVLNGTANETTMLNYQNRIIKPLLKAVTEGFTRKFLTKTARTKGHSIEFFNEPFSLMPASNLASLADKLTRNAILTSNEFRQIIGFKPVLDDPTADQLLNKNLPLPVEPLDPLEEELPIPPDG